MYNGAVRILFVTPYYKPYLGGVERVVENLSREFTNCGHEVAVLTSKYSFPRTHHVEWVKEEDVDGIKVYRLDSWPHRPLPFYAAPLTLFSPQEIRSVTNQLKPEAVIYMTDKWFWTNFWARLFTPRSKQIWCPIFHDLTPAKLWLRPINWLFGKLVSKVVVVTKLEAEKVEKAYGIAKQQVTVIPWGVSLPKIGGKQTTDKVTVLAVGRISRHKGQEWLVKRFLEVSPKVTAKCRLVLVGEVEEQAVLERINALAAGVGEGIVVVETKASDETLAAYYQHADIFALFPEYESFGLVFLEALSYGLPVLTHKVGALAEVLREGAILIPPYDVESANSSLLRMINDVPSGRYWRTRGREFVVQNYSWNKCAEEYLKLIL